MSISRSPFWRAIIASPPPCWRTENLLRNRFRVLCGFSARMPESCWYETNLANLWRYAKNRMRNLVYDKDADVERA